MSDDPKVYERQKFKISLAEYLRRGLDPRDYATYIPKDLVPPSTSVPSASGDPETELTPQQRARKRYEDSVEYGMIFTTAIETKKLGEKKPENAWPRHLIHKANAIDKPAMRNDTAEHIAKNVGMRSGDLALLPATVNVEMDVSNVLKITLLSFHCA
ncbi:hypothetical protein EV360DRAFT_75763 [Lentinula raphanica]|nr:hypothetical protein EV360DRAFT_75763 [Lentinula raphanica]